MADSQLAPVFFEDLARKKKKSKNSEKCKKDKLRKAGKQLSWADKAEDCFASMTQKNTKKAKKNKHKKRKKVKLNPVEGFLSPPQQGPYFSQQQAKQSRIQKKTQETPGHKTDLDLWTHSRNAECARVKRTSVGGEHREMARAIAWASTCKDRCSSSVVSHKVCCGEREAICVPKIENDQEDTQETNGNSSQDLFITQKTFIVAQDSSSEESMSAIPAGIIPAWRPQVRAVVPAQAVVEKATQTENFFSSEAMSVSWAFQRKHQEPKCLEQPIDLSLPRKTGLEMPSKAKGEKSDCCMSAHRNGCVINRNKEKNVPEKNKGNMGKYELKAVQTKLNESFFFKVKGDGDSTKPQSPLMRLHDAGVTKSKLQTTNEHAVSPGIFHDTRMDFTPM
ncbi:uncharacterized protein [Paramormyrops kingsleyae]|uniref:uncharacterized protein n=1 Tax=Paramormyrops kingsleyae TaxID=1676925 RepID=UPI003B970BB0